MAIQRHRNGTNGTTRNTAASLAGYLRGLEEIYHSEMTDEELAVYLESLSRFPLAEVKEAGQQLMVKPIGGWSGIPKLPDFIRKIHEIREDESERKRQRGGWDFSDSNCQHCGGIGWQTKQTARGNLAVERCVCGKELLEAAKAKAGTGE